MRTLDINLKPLKDMAERYCSECDHFQSANCSPTCCVMEFVRKLINFAEKKGTLDIPGAKELIPQDFKYYYSKVILEGVADTCFLCRECRENHSEDCVISVVRHALAGVLLPQNIPYPGSVFLYLLKVKEMDPVLGEELANILAAKAKAGKDAAKTSSCQG